MIEGHFTIFLIFIISIICSALSTVYFNPYISIIGCSSGVYGIIGTIYSLAIINFKSFDKYFQIISCFAMFLILLIQILIYEYDRENNVAYYIHLIGYLYGINISFIIIKPKQEFSYNKYLKYFGLYFTLSLTSLFIFDYITLTSAKNNKYYNECCYIG